MIPGLIVNPQSGKRSGHGLALARRLASSPHVPVAVLESFGALPEVLRKFAGHGVDTVFVSSGDGTVHAVQTELAERNPFPALPRLALLAHGTTNLTAGDVGFRPRGLDHVAAVIADGRDAAGLKRRPTMRVVNPRDGKTRHGMFLGAGAIWQATVFCQEKVHATGLKGDWATFATLAIGIGQALLTPKGPADERRLNRPHPMRIEADGRAIADGPQLLFLATTLEKLILGTRPFWGGRSAPIRASAIAHPPPSIPRWLVRVLYGPEDRKLPHGCLSFAARGLSVATASSFVLDGEFFAAPADQPLRIETGPEFTYVCG